MCCLCRAVGGASQPASSRWPSPLPRSFPQGDSQSLIRPLCEAAWSAALKSWCRTTQQVVRCDTLESACPELGVAKIRHEIRFKFVSVFLASWRQRIGSRMKESTRRWTKQRFPNKKSLSNCCSWLNYLFHILLNPSLCKLKKFPQNIFAMVNLHIYYKFNVFSEHRL